MSSSNHFQKALPTDVDQLFALENLCFGEEGFSKRQLNYLVNKANGEVVVVKISDEIVASFILLFRKKSKHIRIYSLVVSPIARGKGLAREMIDYAEKRTLELGLKQISLEVSENNSGAIQLYQSCGFQIFQMKQAYYKDGSNAFVMRKMVS